ncbi:MAG: hypothetical protein C4308_08795 [Chitinophagaceae bacterium]
MSLLFKIKTFLSMRKALPLASLLLASISFIHTQAQDRFAYAVTDMQQSGAGWTALRKLNLQTGVYSNVLLNGIDLNQTSFDARTKKQLSQTTDAIYGTALQAPFSTGVAAIAYDKKNNRLWFTPMFIDQLRYVDLKTMKVYYVTDKSFTGYGSMHNDEAKVVTRMVIAPDGYGYAITNDGNQFIRFTTGKKLKIEQLGPLADDPDNTGISIHNRCSSFGGDMVADDEGNLYVFSAHNNVFKINIQTKVATWLGPVKNLPGGFTINGAVVNDQGNLLVSSAVFSKSWYTVDPKTWTATEYKSPNGVYLSSDLANSNIWNTRKNTTTEIPTITAKETLPVNGQIQLYPNPVSNYQFNLQIAKAGEYAVVLSDVSGKEVQRQKINVGSENQVQMINISKSLSQGIYLVRVTDISNKAVFVQKLVVQ